jgi:hypothetical protein
MINGVEYVAKLNDVMYQVSNHKKTTLPLALIDRGTNGGVAGSDTWLIDKSLCSVHIQGINNHMIKDVPIGTVGAVVNTQRGEVIAIMHQYAYTGKGGTIHNLVSLNGVAMTSTIVPLRLKVVDNDSLHQMVTSFPSMSCVVCHTSRCAPLQTRNSKSSRTLSGRVKTIGILPPLIVLSLMTLIGTKLNLHLLYPIQCMMSMGSCFCGHVLIDQCEWQVHYFDALDTRQSSDNDEFHDALEQFADNPDSVINLVVYRANCACYVCDHETVEAAPKFVMTSEPDYGQLCPHLGWLPIDAIKKMFKRTTQLARMPMSTILKKRYKSPNPALNVHPRDEPVATNTIYSDTPAIDCSVTSAQLFVGTKTHTADVYPIKSDEQFVKKLLDNITQCGAPTKLISDRAQVEISEPVKQIL